MTHCRLRIHRALHIYRDPPTTNEKQPHPPSLSRCRMATPSRLHTRASSAFLTYHPKHGKDTSSPNSLPVPSSPSASSVIMGVPQSSTLYQYVFDEMDASCSVAHAHQRHDSGASTPHLRETINQLGILSIQLIPPSDTHRTQRLSIASLSCTA